MPVAVGVMADSYNKPAGGWTPADLTGLILWLDASDTATIIHASGVVSAWNDKSGNGRHHVQVTAGHRPSTGSRTVYGLNVIDFDGVDDHLEYTWTVQPQPLTIAAVVHTDSNTNSQVYARTTGTALNLGHGGLWRYAAGTTRTATGFVPDMTRAHVLIGCFQGTSSRLRLDGAQIHDGTAASPGAGGLGADGAATGAYVDGTQPLNGAVGEIVIVTTNLNGTADVTSLETYLRTKWGTP